MGEALNLKDRFALYVLADFLPFPPIERNCFEVRRHGSSVPIMPIDTVARISAGGCEFQCVLQLLIEFFRVLFYLVTQLFGMSPDLTLSPSMHIVRYLLEIFAVLQQGIDEFIVFFLGPLAEF